MFSSIVSPTGTATSRERGSSMAPIDCKPVGAAGALEIAEGSLAIGGGAQPHALHAAAAAAATRLAGRARGDQARRHDHVQPAGRTIVNRQMDPFLALAASDHVEIAGLAGLRVDRPSRSPRRSARTRARLSAAAGGFVWAVAVDAPDEHQATDKARGQPGPDQAKVSPEHRAKTFLDGAVAEGPVDRPYPLRPESPPKLMEMIQFLPGTAGTFSHYRKDASERLNIRACHLFIFGWQTREHRSNRPDGAQDVKLESTPRDRERQKSTSRAQSDYDPGLDRSDVP